VLARLRAAHAPVFGREIEAIRDGCLHLRGGRLRAILATTGMNFLEASDEEQARSCRAFADLLNSLLAPLQIWFRATRLRAGDVPTRPPARTASTRAAAWRRETERFIRGQLDARRIYRRSVHLVVAPRADSASGHPAEERQRLELTRQAHELLELLARLGVRGRRLGTEELQALYAELYGGEAAPAGSLQPNGWTLAPSWFQVSDRYHRSFRLLAYPGGDLEPGWLAPLLAQPQDLQVSVHITPVATERILGFLNSRIRDLRASEMADIDRGIDADPLATEALPQALAFRSTLARNEEKAFAVSVYICTAAPSLPELRQGTAALQAVFTRMLVRAAPAYLRQREALKSVWPLGRDTLGTERLMHTAGLATLFPWLIADLYEPGGHYWGFNKRTAGIVACDPFDTEAFPNANIAIFGHSGAGKTYAASAILLTSYSAGIGSVVLDPEHEYAGLCRALDGTYVEVAAGSPHAINVLDPALQPADEGQDVIGDVLDLIAVMCGGLDGLERARIHRALDHLLAGRKKRPPLLGDLQQLLAVDARAARPAAILERWVSGELGRFFNRQTNVDLQKPVVAFGLRDLQEELVAPAYFLIAAWVWAQVRRVRRPRHLLIDEAGLLFEQAVIRRFLVRLARRIRKYHGSLVIATQNAGDLLSTPEGVVVATNPSILLLGHQRSAEARRLAQAFALTDRQADALQGAHRGEFLMLAGPHRVALEIAPPPWQHELIHASKRLTEPPR